MKNNVLVVVGAVFLVLLIGWFATRQSQPSVGIKELKVQKIKGDDVVKIEITIPGKSTKKNPAAGDEGPVDATTAPPSTVVLERISAKAFTVSDGKGAKHPVDDAQLKPLLDAIGELNAGDVVANKAEKLKDFEIDDAQGTHVVITTTAGKAVDLLFGRAAKGGGTTVREQGSNDVFVAKGRLGTLAKKDAGQWRKKSVLEKKAEDFTSIAITRGDGARIALHGESKEEPAPPPVPGDTKEPMAPRMTTTWTLAEPSSLPASYRLDDAALSRVAGSLATLRATDFADGVDDATAGFVAPHTVVTATGKDGKDTVVHFGAKDDKKRVHVRVDGDPQVYLVAEYAAKNVDKALDDLRDLSLFAARAEDVTQLSVTAGKSRVLVKKDGAEWKLVEPKTAPPDFDAAQIGSVVAGALRLKGVRVATGVTDAGGGDPVIELELANGKRESVRFGKSADVVTEGEKTKELYVKGADGLVYVVSSFTKSRYEKPTELFKKPAAPPAGMGGMGGMGGMQGLDSLPPDIRKKLEASLKSQGLKSP